jgi:antitoxin component YwqK of YwqJK toxin-antitoxin module
MKITVLLLGLFACSYFSFSQQNDEKNFFTVNNDTIELYLNEAGYITTKSKAAFYRKAKIDSENFNYSGIVIDYLMNNQKTYECNYIKNILSGIVRCYYPNGKLKYNGYFNKSNKDSTWIFYYDNGNIEKVVQITDSIPYIKEFYKRNGTIVFNNGNGKYKGVIKFNTEDPLECFISGKIINGKMEGAWNWRGDYCHGIEYFKDGKYIRSENWGLNDGFVEPRVVSLFGVDPHENVNFFRFVAYPQERNKNDVVFKGVPIVFTSKDIASTVYINTSDSSNQSLKYKKSVDLNMTFTNDFTKYVSEVINENRLNNFWCFIQFTVTTNNKVENTNIYTNNEIVNQCLIKYLSNVIDFETAKTNNEPIACNVYLNFYFENGIIYIPEYSFDNLMLKF